MKTHLLPLLLVTSLMLACTDDNVGRNNQTPQECPPGQVRNPITQTCQPSRTVNNPVPTSDMNVTPPGDATPDMPTPAEDMYVPNDMTLPSPDPCTPGMKLGCADDFAEYVCSTDGSKYEPIACPDGQRCLGGECTSKVCLPDSRACEGTNAVKVCNADGTGYMAATTCPEDTVCARNTCTTICELGKYRSSYIGCEYWTLDLDNYPDPAGSPMPNEIPHSVVISNPNDKPVTVSFISRAPGVSVNVPDPVVMPGSAKAFTMPRLDVDGTGITTNSIQIKASLPVVAHQFNPLNDQSVFSNDASLLLPVNTLGVEYFIINWYHQPLPSLPFPGAPMFEDQHAYFTVLATEPGETFINVTPTAEIKSGGGINGWPAGVTRSFSLRQGEVLNLEAGGMVSLGSPPPDLTGTFIRSTQPVAVFAGHEEAVIGQAEMEDSCCADHLEQQMFPLKDWGQRYIAALSPGRGTKKDHWRILAGENGVRITTNPPQPEANDITLNKGEFVTFFSDQDFEITATGKILVGQFLVSQEQTSEVTGDPAFLLSVPVERFRKDYHLLTPMGYTSDFVMVVRPAGATINLNGVPIANTEFTPVSTGAYEVARIRVQAGVQVLDSDADFGISAYGFDNAVSYGYPGGLNLVGAEMN